MKIALVILHADPLRGGAERYTVDLAAGLRTRGHEVSLVASSFPKDHSGLSSLLTDDVLLSVGRGTRLGRYRRFLQALDEHLAQHTYDIVHAMLPVRRCDVYHPHAGIAAEAVRSGHLKYSGAFARTAAQIANRTNLKRRKFAAVERKLLTGVDPPVVLCLSEYVKRNVTAHYALPPNRLATLFNAVDLARFDPAARPQAGEPIRKQHQIAPDAPVALMIAQDFARKGLREAILALGCRGDDRWGRLVLLVVGKENPARYQKLARDLGIEDRVIFAGATTDPYAFYRAANFFVLPTRHDPCSLVVLEALAMGLPVISTAMNGACEIMTPGVHGFVLPDPTDVDALAQAMRSLLDPAKRQEISAACMAFRPRLAYGHHVDELLRIYSLVSRQ